MTRTATLFLTVALAALASPARADVFCYYLIAEDGTIQVYKRPPLDISLDPDHPDTVPPAVGGHLVIAQAERCRSQVRPRQDVTRPQPLAN